MGNKVLKKELGLCVRLLFFVFLYCIVTFHAEVVGQSSNGLSVAKRATQDRLFAPQKFEFHIGDIHYLVLANGDGVRTSSRGKSANFTLPLDDGFYIERLDYLDREGDLIIIYGVSDDDAAGGSVIRIDNRTLKKKWLANVPGFNIGESLAKHHYLYLSAIGFVGKLDLDSGKYAWQHDGLYKKKPGIFNSFEKPVIERDVVKFTEVLSPYAKGSPVTIVIKDKTGHIISPRF